MLATAVNPLWHTLEKKEMKRRGIKYEEHNEK
jgi:hypothetical protein